MTTVLCFGDSNTHGTPPLPEPGASGRYDRTTRWPGVLRAALGPAFEVVEEGLPGRTTVHHDPVMGPVMDGLRILPPLLHSHQPVDLVVTMLGTNDLKMRFAVTPLEIGEGCRQLLRVIAASDAGPEGRAPRALLVCPPPVVETGWLAEMFAGGAEKSRALPGVLAEVARQEGAAFLDAGTVIAVDPVDGVHVSAASHGILGRAVADAVRKALPDA